MCLYTLHFIHVVFRPAFEWEKGQEATIWAASHPVVREYKLILITQMRMLLMYLGFDTRVFFLLIILIGWGQFL